MCDSVDSAIPPISDIFKQIAPDAVIPTPAENYEYFTINGQKGLELYQIRVHNLAASRERRMRSKGVSMTKTRVLYANRAFKALTAQSNSIAQSPLKPNQFSGSVPLLTQKPNSNPVSHSLDYLSEAIKDDFANELTEKINTLKASKDQKVRSSESLHVDPKKRTRKPRSRQGTSTGYSRNSVYSSTERTDPVHDYRISLPRKSSPVQSCDELDTDLSFPSSAIQLAEIQSKNNSSKRKSVLTQIKPKPQDSVPTTRSTEPPKSKIVQLPLLSEDLEKAKESESLVARKKKVRNTVQVIVGDNYSSLRKSHDEVIALYHALRHKKVNIDLGTLERAILPVSDFAKKPIEIIHTDQEDLVVTPTTNEKEHARRKQTKERPLSNTHAISTGVKLILTKILNQAVIIAEPKYEPQRIKNRFQNVVHKRQNTYQSIEPKVNCWWQKSEYDVMREKIIDARKERQVKSNLLSKSRSETRTTFQTLVCSTPKKLESKNGANMYLSTAEWLEKSRPVSRASDTTSSLFSAGPVSFKTVQPNHRNSSYHRLKRFQNENDSLLREHATLSGERFVAGSTNFQGPRSEINLTFEY